jgi:hypothetical protein
MKQYIVRTTKDLLRPFQTFFQTAASGGIVLLVCAAAALLLATSGQCWMPPVRVSYRWRTMSVTTSRGMMDNTLSRNRRTASTAMQAA